MISSVPEDPEGTQHVEDGPAPSTETQYVPDGTVLGPAVSKPSIPKSGATKSRAMSEPSRSPWARPMGSRPPDETQHVDDLPCFGRFRALAEIGSGAMGTVYRAHDDVLGRSVAIKALMSRDKSVRERFLREARAIGAVLHPNILAVYDAGTDAETPYIVTELAAGGSLRDRIQEGALPVDTVRELGIQIARALAAAHAANILHRDVKPANILLAGDTWKLADFGIARMPDSTLTVEGQFMGSPSYAAPESLRAGQFSPASDIYGLGATLYEALAGAPPHGDHDMQSVVRKLEHDAPPLVTRRQVPGPLNDALMATLARDPAKRPTADELARMLANTSDERPVPRAAPSTRTKVLALALAAVAIALVIIAIMRDKPTTAPNLQPSFDPRAKAVEPRKKDQPRSREDEQREDEQHFAQPPGAPEAPNAPEVPLEPSQPQPQVVDPWGNPVDDETAAKILDQMHRDAQSEMDNWGHKRKRRKH